MSKHHNFGNMRSMFLDDDFLNTNFSNISIDDKNVKKSEKADSLKDAEKSPKGALSALRDSSEAYVEDSDNDVSFTPLSLNNNEGNFQNFRNSSGGMKYPNPPNIYQFQDYYFDRCSESQMYPNSRPRLENITNNMSINNIAFFPKNFTPTGRYSNNMVINPTNELTRSIPFTLQMKSTTPNKLFMHGKPGWICVHCSNFNYEGIYLINPVRVKCNRCGNLQINESEKNTESLFIENNKPVSNMTSSTQDSLDLSNEKKKTKKPFVERVGDWVCIKCKNLNFSFRVICNRCHMTKVDSEILFEQYMRNLTEFEKFRQSRNDYQNESYKFIGNHSGNIPCYNLFRNSK